MADRTEQPSDAQPLETHENITRAMAEVPVKYAQDFIRVYGSQIGLGSSIWDISFSIGQPIVDDPNNIHIEQRALVTVSWPVAKAFAGILVNAIGNHEQQFGEIRLTPLPTKSD